MKTMTVAEYESHTPGCAVRKTGGSCTCDARPPVTFASGAVRSELKPRYDLIPRVALERLALRYAMGAEKYGDYNYEKGLPLSDTLNHIVDHLLRYRDRMRAGEPMTDDDLAGAMWGCAALMRLEELGKLL